MSEFIYLLQLICLNENYLSVTYLQKLGTKNLPLVNFVFGSRSCVLKKLLTFGLEEVRN
jgi:hypothetical protein